MMKVGCIPMELKRGRLDHSELNEYVEKLNSDGFTIDSARLTTEQGSEHLLMLAQMCILSHKD